MIRISQIDDNFSVYKDGFVVLIGIGNGIKSLIDLFRYHKIKIHAICDNNPENLGKQFEFISIVSPQELSAIIKKVKQSTPPPKHFVAQVTGTNIVLDVEQYFKPLGFDTFISYKEAYNVINFMNKFKLVKENPQMLAAYDLLKTSIRETVETAEFYDHIASNFHSEQFLFICSVQKTGDVTLNHTFENHQIPSRFTLHTPEVFNTEIMSNIDRKFKIITAVRDPLSQNLSYIYHFIDMMFRHPASFQLKMNSDTFFENGGDVQDLFDVRFNNMDETNIIPDFMERFKENVLDLSSFPFDKEKGYAIIKEGNIEIFVYQLEKMNDIVNEMSDWVGQTPFRSWTIGNVADNKWIAPSYKQAQKEIKISKEHFDRSYDNKWIRHFYSDEDIEKFKERWRPHIKSDN